MQSQRVEPTRGQCTIPCYPCCWWACRALSSDSSRVRGETSHGERVERGPKDQEAQQWDTLKGQQMLLRYCNTLFCICHYCHSLLAFILSKPTFLCDGLTGNVVAAWLWSMGVTDQSTCFKTMCSHFSWCLCCHKSLFPASALTWPSSEAGTYFASDLSGKKSVNDCFFLWQRSTQSIAWVQENTKCWYAHSFSVVNLLFRGCAPCSWDKVIAHLSQHALAAYKLPKGGYQGPSL